jgi:hypothetical protein
MWPWTRIKELEDEVFDLKLNKVKCFVFDDPEYKRVVDCLHKAAAERDALKEENKKLKRPLRLFKVHCFGPTYVPIGVLGYEHYVMCRVQDTMSIQIEGTDGKIHEFANVYALTVEDPK